MEKHVLTVRDVAAYLGVHTSTVYRLLKRGELPAFKVGSDWRFNRESIDRWRLAQEQAYRQMVSSQRASSQALANEVFHVVYWYVTEGLNETVTTNDIRLFVERTEAAITRELNRLVREGMLEKKKGGGEIGYSLTPQGLYRARQFYDGERVLSAGHTSAVELELQRNEEGPHPTR